MATRLHWRKHYCGDFLGRVSWWPLEAVGCYAVLMDLIYLNGPMADSEMELHLSRIAPQGRELIRQILTRHSSGWTHHRIEEDRQHSAHVSEIRRLARLGNSNNSSTTEPQEQHNCAQDAHKTVDVSVDASVSAPASVRKGRPEGKPGLSGRDTDRVRWDFGSEAWVGLDAAAIADLSKSFPGVDITATLASLADWCIQHPAKVRQRKSTDAFIRQCIRNHPIYLPGHRSTKFETRHQETSEEKSARIRRDSEAQLARVAAKRAASGADGSTNALRGTQDSGSLLGAS